MRYSSGLAAIMLLSFGLGYAQPPGNTEVRIRANAIQGPMISGDTLFPIRDGIVKFPFEYVNRDTVAYDVQNYYVIYSPDGVTWAHATGDGGNYKGFTPDVFGIWVDTTGYFPKVDFLGLFRFACFGCNGAGADTLRFSGVASDPSERALRPLDSGIHFYAIVKVKATDVGKHICIDSVSRSSCCTWMWPSFNYQPAYTAHPAWNGPYCFVIGGCCRGLTGNYDCDPEDKCDIADIAAFVARYTTLEMPCCSGEANTDGSPDGISDISDLTALIDYLYINFTPPAPCR